MWTLLCIVFALGVAIGATSAVQIAPHMKTTDVVSAGAAIDGSGTAPGVKVGKDSRLPGTTQEIQESIAPSVAPPGLKCERGKNGGSTDVGVTADSISLATTTAESGLAAAFLGEAKFAMEAIKNEVNSQGGICGRMLKITYVDDGWDAARGANYLRNFIKSGVFAIPVAPSSEGLRVVIDNGDIDKAQIPVVGTDGMLIDQYRDPWVWPVAVATATSARIMARNAYKRGARDFSIVFDKNYRFGVEAAQAYNEEVKSLTHSNIRGYNTDNNCQISYCGILAGQSSYASEVQQFKPGTFVAMFLEPQTALTWNNTPGSPKPKHTAYGIGAGQPLFTRDFGNNCQANCDGMWVWTGYRPPIEQYASQPAVKKFVSDLHRAKPQADEHNAFTEGAYVGMDLLVQALRKVGPFLTRARLKSVLDSMTFNDGLPLQDTLSWHPDHFSTKTMQAFEMLYSGTFSGWRSQVIEKAP